MAKESKIAMKLEEESKDIQKLCDKLTSSITQELEKGIEQVETKELGEAVDMVKDLYEAKKYMYEACYYKQIMEAMEEAEYGEDYDEHGRLYYRGQRRDSMGRYTSRGGRSGRSGRRGYEDMMPMVYDGEYPIQYDRDMDMDLGRMYYSGEGSGNSGGGRSGQGGSRGGNSRYGFAHDQYMENRSKHSKSSPEESGKRMELLGDFMDDLEDMAKDVVKGMTPEEKQVWRVKLNKLISM